MHDHLGVGFTGVISSDVLLDEFRMVGTELAQRALETTFRVLSVAHLTVDAALFHVGVDRLFRFFVRELQDFEAGIRMTFLRVALRTGYIGVRKEDVPVRTYLNVPSKIGSPTAD